MVSALCWDDGPCALRSAVFVHYSKDLFGIGLTPNVDENMVFTSVRYYLP